MESAPLAFSRWSQTAIDPSLEALDRRSGGSGGNRRRKYRPYKESGANVNSLGLCGSQAICLTLQVWMASVTSRALLSTSLRMMVWSPDAVACVSSSGHGQNLACKSRSSHTQTHDARIVRAPLDVKDGILVRLEGAEKGSCKRE